LLALPRVPSVPPLSCRPSGHHARLVFFSERRPMRYCFYVIEFILFGNSGVRLRCAYQFDTAAQSSSKRNAAYSLFGGTIATTQSTHTSPHSSRATQHLTLVQGYPHIIRRVAPMQTPTRLVYIQTQHQSLIISAFN
jgi:hypothetical protein